MPKFDAGSVSAIEYDFSGFKDDNGLPIEDKGSVPEPSRAHVNQVMKQIQAAFKEMGFDDVDSPEDVSSRMNRIEDEDMFEKMTEKLVGLISDLCGGSPSYESINRLPYRPFMAFFGYLMGEVMSPETSKPATNPSQNRLRSV